MAAPAQIAYFSMEIALDERFSTYSGGLGILAGDTLRSAADLGLPMVAVTLAYPNGYFRQTLDAAGIQHESPDMWSPAKLLKPVIARVTVQIEGRDVRVAAWRFDVVGVNHQVVRAYLLDTDLEENTPEDRAITATLYGGDARYRLAQEIVLGIGGGRMLEALGHRSIETYHMNEGHAALVALDLLERTPGTARESLEPVKPLCVFTTHTPMPAGHDRFDVALLQRVLGPEPTERLRRLGLIEDGVLNMTHLALRASRFVNAVAMRHGEVSRDMFPGYAIARSPSGGATTINCVTRSASMSSSCKRRTSKRSTRSSPRSSSARACSWQPTFSPWALRAARRRTSAPSGCSTIPNVCARSRPRSGAFKSCTAARRIRTTNLGKPGFASCTKRARRCVTPSRSCTSRTTT
jgi:alpha-glucan phosphorylase-like protein